MMITFNNYNYRNVSFAASKKINVPKEEIEKLINEGKNLREIGSFYGKHSGWASFITKAYGLKTIRAQKREQLMADLPNLLKTRTTKSNISREYKISPKTLDKIIEKMFGYNNLGINKNKVRDEKILSELPELLKEGYTYKQIAPKFGICVSRIAEFAKIIIGDRNLAMQKIIWKHPDIFTEIPNLLKQGYSIIKIAEKYDISKAWAERLINETCGYKSLNSTRKPRKQQKPEDYEKQIRMVLKNNLKEDINSKVENVLQEIRLGNSLISALKRFKLNTNFAKRYISEKTLKEAITEGQEFNKNKILDMIKEGLNLKAIAKKLNCSLDKIFKMLGDDKQKNWRRELKKECFEKVIRLENQGFSLEEISKSLNLPASIIKEVINSTSKIRK